MKEGADVVLRELEGLFVQLRHHMRRTMSSNITDVPYGQLFIIKQIAAGRTRVSDLSGDIEASPAAASKAVDQLVKLGYISRRRSEEDRRSTLLGLTRKGQALLARSVRMRSRAMMALLEPLDVDELAQLATLMKKMVQSPGGQPAAGSVQGCGDPPEDGQQPGRRGVDGARS